MTTMYYQPIIKGQRMFLIYITSSIIICRKLLWRWRQRLLQLVESKKNLTIIGQYYQCQLYTIWSELLVMQYAEAAVY